jgi:hypothetical protein
MLKNLITAIMAFCLMAMTLGCGGGDSSGGGDPEAVSMKKGVFLDSAVEGLDYVTETHTGRTDSTGRFFYQDGESIRFFIGDMEIGECLARDVVTPVDLADGAEDETDPGVTNIARFLQSLDNDGDPANGIVLSAEVRNECRGRSIAFDQNPENFENDPEVGAMFDALNARGAFLDPSPRGLCSIEEARSHLKKTLESLSDPKNPGGGDDDGGTGGDSGSGGTDGSGGG